MGVGRVLGLLVLLVVLLTMPTARADSCGEREYFHEDRCCVFCEAGTFVANHCNASHLRGKCDPCKEGEDFTAHENGLEGCLPCRRCKEGQITVRPCTLTQNAGCQCKQGYFCADEGCEICQRHSQMCTSIKVYACSIHDSKLCLKKNQAWTELHIALEMLVQPCVAIYFRHPDREEITPNCSDTTDPGCGLPSQGKGALVSVILVVVLGLGLLLLFVLKKLKCNRAASTHKDAERGLKKIEENSVVSEQGTILCRGWKCCMTVWLRKILSSLPVEPVQNYAFQQNAPSNVPSGTPANCTRTKVSDNC